MIMTCGFDTGYAVRDNTIRHNVLYLWESREDFNTVIIQYALIQFDMDQ